MNNINHYRLVPGMVNYWGDILGNISDQQDLVDYISTHGGGGGGEAVWGGITGNLSDQTDLMNMMSTFATQSWVSGQGYLTSVPESYATQSWVESQGYLTAIPAGYATETFVTSALSSTVSDITSELSSYATQSWVESQGYLTSHQDLTEYATQSWVSEQGYLSSVPSEYATQSWVSEQGYLTEHQQLKTVNNQSLVGEGNIEVGGLTPEQEEAIDPLMNPEEGIIVHTVLKSNVLVENRGLSMTTSWVGHQSEVDGDFYCINNGNIFKFNKKRYIYEQLNNNYIETYGDYILWKDNSGRYYVNSDYQIDMNTLQLTPVNLQIRNYNNTDPGNRSNIWKGQYGIYQLSSQPQKFDEENQIFVDWPNVNITEGYDLGAIGSNFGTSSFTYDGHIIMVYGDGSMWEMTEYEDHIDIDKVDNPYFPIEYNGTVLGSSDRYFNVNGILYYFGNNIPKPLKFVNGSWVEFDIYNKNGYTYSYYGGYYPGVFYGNILLGGCFFNNPDYFCSVNLSSEEAEYTIWQDVNTVTVDLKSNQTIYGQKRFQNDLYANNLYIYNVGHTYNTTSVNLGKNTTTADKIKLTTSSFVLNDIPVATKSDCILNSRLLPYGGIVSEETVTSLGSGNRQYNFTTHTGRIFNEDDSGTWYEFDGTQFIALPESRDWVDGNSVVVTPNATFHNTNGYTYIWNDTTSNFEQLCEGPNVAGIWSYWWDGTNLRYRGDSKLVYDNDTWSWTEDSIPDWKEGMYHYVNNRVIVLGNDSLVYEYDPINKTYTQLGWYDRWIDNSFVIGGDIIYPYNGESFYKIDLSKVTPEGTSTISTITTIPYFEYYYFAAEYEGKMWYFRDYQAFAYCYDIEYTSPAVPATDGTYVLKATVVDGQVTYSWETDETAQALQITNEILS